MTGKRRRLPIKQQSVCIADRSYDSSDRSRQRLRSGSATFLASSTFASPALSRHGADDRSAALAVDEAAKNAPVTATANRLGFRLGKRKMLTDKRRFISNCCLACAMFGIAGMIVETELTMARVYDKSSIYSYMVKTSVTASTIVLLNLILAYYRLQAQLYIVNNSLDDWKVALSWPMVFQATTELVVCSIHPFPGDLRFTWYSVGGLTYDNSDDDDVDDNDVGNDLFKGIAYNLGYHSDEGLHDTDADDDDGVSSRHHPQYGEGEDGVVKRRKRSANLVNNKQGAEASVDLLFTFPMFLRFYLVGRVMLLQSRILTDASAVSIGALNRISFNVRFVLKALMTICPGTVLVVFMMTVWILTSWTLRVCESYHDMKHRNFLNSLWMIAITFLSVGYGDIVPNTYCGRSVAVFTGIMGSGCTALVVAVFARKMELTRAEKHVHNFMIDNQLSKKLKHAAANVLRETWFIYKYTSLSSKLDPFKIRCHQSKFLQAIHNLRDIRSKLRTLNDNANTMMDVSRHLTHSALNTTPTVYSSQPPAIYQQMQVQLTQAITDLYDRQLSTEKRTSGIETTVAWMQNHLEGLPNLVMEQLSVEQLLDLNSEQDWNVQSSFENECLLTNANLSSTIPAYSISDV